MLSQFEYDTIKQSCLDLYLKNYKINRFTGVVDVNDDVVISSRELYNIPVQFGTVTGKFYCHNNHLTDLKGCPYKVMGDFDCHNNCLTSLEDFPISINGAAYVSQNPGMSYILTPLFKSTVTWDIIYTARFGANQFDYNLPYIFDIINKWLPSKDILSCVDELLDGGYEIYCKL